MNGDSDNPFSVRGPQEQAERLLSAQQLLRTAGGVRGVPAEHPTATWERGRECDITQTENFNILI